MAKPSIILVPGSFCNPEYYDPLVAAVKARGYSMRAINVRTQIPGHMASNELLLREEEEKQRQEGSDIERPLTLFSLLSQISQTLLYTRLNPPPSIIPSPDRKSVV